jgi:hypothetical protein
MMYPSKRRAGETRTAQLLTSRQGASLRRNVISWEITILSITLSVAIDLRSLSQRQKTGRRNLSKVAEHGCE